MSSHYFATGIILDKVDYRENDQVFDVYTKEFGKIKILGKATRKIKSKLRSGMNTLSYSEMEFIEGKSNKILINSRRIKKFEKIFCDLVKLKIIYSVSDILNQLAHYEEKDEDIFTLMNETMERVENCEEKNEEKKLKKLKIIYFYFLWNFISALGYQINLYNCCSCNKKLLPYKLCFNHEKEGIVCANCQNNEANNFYILPETIKIVRILLGNDWNFVSKLAVENEGLNDMASFGLKYLSYIRGMARSCK